MGTLRTGALTRRRVGVRAADLEYAVLDLETTGLDPGTGARVVEAAVVRVRGDGKVVEEFSSLVDPRAEVFGQGFHGIHASEVVGAPTVADLVPHLTRLFSGAVVVSHNLDFEQRFLSSELLPAGLPEGHAGLCTLRALRAQIDLERYSLPRASHALSGHWPTGQHTALGDARACAMLLVELIANAPGPLRYRGLLPRVLPAPRANGPEPARWKPRTNPLPGGLEAPRTWGAPWRPTELDPLLCGGAFGDTDRMIAERAALHSTRSRRRMVTAAALAGGVAATAAGGMLAHLAGLKNRTG